MENPPVNHRRGQRPLLQHLRAIGDLTFQSWKVQNEVVSADQPKTMIRVGAETCEAGIGSVAVVEAAMAAEVAETSMTEASSMVVAATAVVTTVAAAAVAAVQAG